MKKLYLLSGIFLGLTSLACNNDLKNTGEEIDKTPIYAPVPESYNNAIDQAGTIESISYYTNQNSEESINKTAYVYLPYQYDDTQQYNILYLMHGGGGSNSTLMGNTNHCTSLKFVLDNMIKDKLIEPIIVVTPTFYNGGADDRDMAKANNLTHLFQKELRENLIPAVEGKYSTFSLSTSVEDLTNSREHRAFSGFSMGSVTTWYAIAENLAYFRNFIPASGDCWAIEQMGGRTKSQETAEYLANSIKNQGHTPLDFFIFAVTGTGDIAYENLTPQINAMKTLTDSFIYDANPENGNLFYLEAKDGVHNYDWYNDYLYDILPYIF